MLRLQLLQCFWALPLLLLHRVRSAALSAVSHLWQACSCMRCTSWSAPAWLLKGLTRCVGLCCCQHRSGTATAPLENGDDPSCLVLTQQGECLWRVSSKLCSGLFKAHLACPRKAPTQPLCGVSWVRLLLRGKPAYFAERIARATRLWRKGAGEGRLACKSFT